MSCNENFADANRVRLASIEETEFCEFPDPADMQIMRMVSADLSATKETSASDEIRSDRQVSDVAELSFSTGGSVAVEWSLTTYDLQWLEGALCNRWSVSGSGSFTITAAIDTPEAGQVTLTAVELDTLTFVATDWVFIQTVSGAIDGFYQVIAQAPGELVISDPNADFTNGSTTAIVGGNTLINGVEKISYALEVGFMDALAFKLYHGQRVSTWSLSVEAAARVTGSFGFMGTLEEHGNTEYGTSYLPATKTPQITATSNTGTILIDGQPLDVCIQSVAIELDNSLREQRGVGNKFPCGVGLGRQVITGTLAAYFADFTLYNKFFNHGNISLEVPFTDSDGNQFLIELPKCILTSDPLAVSGTDTDIMDDVAFQAVVGDDGYTIKLTALNITEIAPGATLSAAQATVGTPANIYLQGWFLQGTVLNASFAPDGGQIFEAPYTITEDMSGENAAQGWAKFITGVDGLTTKNSKGRTIAIEPFAPATTVDITNLTVTPPILLAAKTTKPKKKGKK